MVSLNYFYVTLALLQRFQSCIFVFESESRNRLWFIVVIFIRRFGALLRTTTASMFLNPFFKHIDGSLNIAFFIFRFRNFSLKDEKKEQKLEFETPY